jgi:hypothetical protein
LYGLLAAFAFNDGRFDQLAEFVALGIDDPDPDVSQGCRTLLLVMHAAQGNTAEIEAMLPAMLEQADQPLRPISAITTNTTVLNSLSAGTPERAAALDRFAALARRLGAPWALSEYHYLASFQDIERLGPDEFAAALDHSDKSIEFGTSGGSDLTWAHTARAGLLARYGDPSAATAARAALAAAYDRRHWLATATTLEVVAAALSTAGSDDAAVVLGYIELSPPPWGNNMGSIRRLALDQLADLSDLDALRSRGAAMDRHEIVAFALGALDRVIASSS